MGMSEFERLARADMARRTAWSERQRTKQRRVLIGFGMWLAILVVAMIVVG